MHMPTSIQWNFQTINPQSKQAKCISKKYCRSKNFSSNKNSYV
jgi:hypothetical protein